GSRVEFLGWLDETELSGLLGRVRALVVASVPGRRPEGSSLSAVEAARHRRVVIGSDDPAVSEVVTSLGAGPVVPAGNVGVLAAALRDVLANDEAVAAYAEAAAAGAQAHSIEAVTAATREVYQQVLAGRPGSRA
ncbi:MAG TPA: glycosyltransferase, partial [Marmoricola sp.]|nr:glycosyltransferase [Marmoricola sp.]